MSCCWKEIHSRASCPNLLHSRLILCKSSLCCILHNPTYFCILLVSQLFKFEWFTHFIMHDFMCFVLPSAITLSSSFISSYPLLSYQLAGKAPLAYTVPLSMYFNQSALNESYNSSVAPRWVRLHCFRLFVMQFILRSLNGRSICFSSNIDCQLTYIYGRMWLLIVKPSEDSEWLVSGAWLLWGAS